MKSGCGTVKVLDCGNTYLSSSAKKCLPAAICSETAVVRLEEEFRLLVARVSNSIVNDGTQETDLLSPDAIAELRLIAERMIAGGYGWECFCAYGKARKPSLELCFQHLGIESLTIADIQQLEWEFLESKIRRWIRAARVCFRAIFALERRLCGRIFDRLSSNDAAFAEAVKIPAIQLLSFAEAISISCRSPEKLFKVLDLHDALSDLLPDIASLFGSRALEPIRAQVVEIVARLGELIRGILSEFENAILKETSRVPIQGGTVHPLTRYVMNYISLISDYKQSLLQLINSRPPTMNLLADVDAELAEPGDEQSPLASHLIWIISTLQFNIRNKAQGYRDPALSNLFMTNNLHYIVEKVKASEELREVIGDDCRRKLEGKVRQMATDYERAGWANILRCLREEGMNASPSSSKAGIIRERFKAFNAGFERAHKTQAGWSVPDAQLREELRISILEKLLPAYRSFIGRFGHHLDSRKHPETYIKYSAEDLEMALGDFFQGCCLSPPAPPRRRRNPH